jgi:hypothetical protein
MMPPAEATQQPGEHQTVTINEDEYATLKQESAILREIRRLTP